MYFIYEFNLLILVAIFLYLLVDIGKVVTNQNLLLVGPICIVFENKIWLKQNVREFVREIHIIFLYLAVKIIGFSSTLSGENTCILWKCQGILYHAMHISSRSTV